MFNAHQGEMFVYCMFLTVQVDEMDPNLTNDSRFLKNTNVFVFLGK